MYDSRSKTMRRTGAWCIAMGVTILTIGIAIGVGSIVAGGTLLRKSAR